MCCPPECGIGAVAAKRAELAAEIAELNDRNDAGTQQRFDNLLAGVDHIDVQISDVVAKHDEAMATIAQRRLRRRHRDRDGRWARGAGEFRDKQLNVTRGLKWASS